MIKLSECNNCARDCDGTKTKNFQCKEWKKPRQRKYPIFPQLFIDERKRPTAIRLLELADLKVSESPKYPYFSLQPRKR